MSNRMTGVLIAAIAVLIILWLSFFTVDQREKALVFQLGEIRDVVTDPGLHFKWPLIQNVRHYDNRILTLDTPDAERFLTSEKKNVLVDSFVKWRIADLRQYYVSVQGDETRAQLRMSQTVNSLLREEFGKRTVHEVVSGERDDIMRIVREKLEEDAKRIGLVNEVVPAPDLLDTAVSWAGKIAANAPLAIRFALEAVNHGLEMTLPEGLFLEATLFSLCCTTEDMKEGTKAFLEKRPAQWTGR